MKHRYKHTDVGAIPLDWKVQLLNQLAEIRSGGTPSTTQPRFWDGDIPWCTPTDITRLDGHKYLIQTERKITTSGLKNSSAEILPVDSILMTSRATIGESAINKVPISTNQGFKNFVPFANVDVDFLYYLIKMHKQTFISLCGGSTFLEIGKKQLEIFPVALPDNLNEQQAIGRALSDADALAEGLEKLLEKKKRIKQGAMQELFTGNRRLPGSSGKPKIMKLGNIADMSSGGTPLSSVPDYYDGNIPWVSISDMTRRGKYIHETDRNITDKGFQNSSAKLFPSGTILYAMYASIGECSIAMTELCSSQAILGIRPKIMLNNYYLYFYLNSIKEEIKLLGQQGTQVNLNAQIVKNFEIPLLPLVEQIAIVEVLNDMDNELFELEQKIKKAHNLKNGMMQELLTGRIRLI